MIFNERLKEMRTARGWSMQDVGVLAGLSKGYIHALESGKSSPTLDKVASLARAFGVTVGEFLGDPVPNCSEDECLIIMALRDGNKLQAIEILLECNRI